MANRRILIVNPESIIARDLEAKLAGFGYEVTGIASSGREAIALAEQTAPNLILMNIALKGDMDGIEAAAEIHKRWLIPIIYLTPYTDEATLQGAKMTKPFGYMVKPFTERELRANIEMALYKDEAIKRERDLEERFFAVSIDMLCFLDFSGYFKRLGHAWEKTLGFSREELMSKPFIEFVHPEDRERTLKQNRKVRDGAKRSPLKTATSVKTALTNGSCGIQCPTPSTRSSTPWRVTSHRASRHRRSESNRCESYRRCWLKSKPYKRSCRFALL